LSSATFTRAPSERGTSQSPTLRLAPNDLAAVELLARRYVPYHRKIDDTLGGSSCSTSRHPSVGHADNDTKMPDRWEPILLATYGKVTVPPIVALQNNGYATLRRVAIFSRTLLLTLHPVPFGQHFVNGCNVMLDSILPIYELFTTPFHVFQLKGVH